MNASLSAFATTGADQPVRALNLPGIERAGAYALACAWGALRTQRREPEASVQPGRGYTGSFDLTPTLHQRWHAFFRTDATRAIPYFYAQGAATLLRQRLLSDLGVRPGQVRHLRQVTRHVRGAEPQARVARQRLDCRLQRVCMLATGLVMVVTDTRLCGADGQALASIEDSWSVAGIDTAAWPALHHDRSVVADFAQLRQRGASLPRMDANVGEWVVGKDWGARYAALSGEWRLRHLGAALFGGGPTTLQATALRNLVVRQLADIGILPEHLDICFSRPVPLGERIRIVQRDDRFEVLDGNGRLAACGSC